MARKNPTAQQGGEEFDTPGKHVIDTPLSDEVKKSYLEYAYSVIHSRALPDARDGLKPVHRRILYTMYNMGLRPNAPQVKSARVVGDALGRFHPHGDSSVYEALVRMAQPFSLNTPLIDGHGNFGSPNDGAAAMRYTECRLAPPAMLMVGEITENTVDFVPNYDNSLEEPVVLPAAFPNLLVNGTSGIAVGMATNMIPHNLKEVIAATRHLLAKPDSTVDDLMQFLPGPDLPTGGQILGADQVKEAYRTGKGTVRIRAKVTVEPIEGSRGRNQIVVTELPYQVGTEKVIESIKSEVAKKRLAGVSDVKDLSDRRHGLRLVIECKTGVNPQALLSELYKYTPLETSFGINNLALVDGQPKVLGLVELLSVFLSHRKEVVTRRTQFRLNNAEARAHIVEGLLIALDAVDEVVKTIRASKDTAAAKTSLVKKFKLSDIQASHILEMPLRKLVNLEVVALRKEQKELAATIKHLKKILSDAKTMNALIDSELANVVENFGVDRQSELVDGDLKDILEASSPAGPVVIPDEPCIVLFSSTGLLARTVAPSEEPPAAGRGVRHAAVRTSPVVSTTRGQVLAVTNTGRAFKVDTINLPPVPTGKQLSLRGGVSGKEIVPLQPNERIVTVVPLTTEGKGIALGTKEGKVKICAPDWPSRGEEFTVISLTGGDEVVGAGWVNEDSDRLAFVSSDSSLLTYDAKNVRAQGRSGGGMSGVKLAAGKHVVFFGVVSGSDMPDAEVITYTGHSAKKAKFVDYPTKGRGTGGVRSHKFLKGEDTIVDAWIGKNPTAGKENGTMVELPKTVGKRDGSGVPQEPFDVLGGSVTDGEVKTLTVVPPAAATETPE